MLDRITQGEGKAKDLQLLQELGEDIKEFALCGLGKTGPNPAMTAIKYFREEFEAHVIDKRCPARVCSALLEYKIDAQACKKCGLCAKECQQGAIDWEPKQLAQIEAAKCVKCGRCVDACRFQAIY
jgi:ferredoxin